MQADFRNDYAEAARLLRPGAGARPGERRAADQRRGRRRSRSATSPTARPLADRLEARDPGNQVAALVRLADALAAGDFAAAAAMLDGGRRRRSTRCSAGCSPAGSRSAARTSPPPRPRFDAMTGNDALAAYGQYHKALALALAGDFVSAEAILAGGEDGPLHLNRSAIVAHAADPRPDRPRGRRDRADRRGAGRRRARRAAARRCATGSPPARRCPSTRSPARATARPRRS